MSWASRGTAQMITSITATSSSVTFIYHIIYKLVTGSSSHSLAPIECPKQKPAVFLPAPFPFVLGAQHQPGRARSSVVLSASLSLSPSLSLLHHQNNNLHHQDYSTTPSIPSPSTTPSGTQLPFPQLSLFNLGFSITRRLQTNPPLTPVCNSPPASSKDIHHFKGIC